jgi:hypothetical protein
MVGVIDYKVVLLPAMVIRINVGDQDHHIEGEC